jgi:molybdate transport system substrate-binding protein
MKARSLLLPVLFAATLPLLAGEVLVAVAANFAEPMKKVGQAFEQETGHQARLSFGSSGKFYAQIRQGAPFDLLLSADQAVPEALEREGYGVAGSRFTYAIGQLVLWSSKPHLVDDQGEILRKGNFSHLALANPRLAPYGQAARQALEALALWEPLSGKLVFAENIGQTHQFIASGNAELGFVALSQLSRGGRVHGGSAWLVPATLYKPIRQDALLLRQAAGKEAAHALLEFLKSSTARTVLLEYGYQI